MCIETDTAGSCLKAREELVVVGPRQIETDVRTTSGSCLNVSEVVVMRVTGVSGGLTRQIWEKTGNNKGCCLFL